MKHLVLCRDDRNCAGDFAIRHHVLHRRADPGEHRFGGEGRAREAKCGSEGETGDGAGEVHGEKWDL